MASRSEPLLVSSLGGNKMESVRNSHLLEVLCARNRPLLTLRYGFSILSCLILAMKERYKISQCTYCVIKGRATFRWDI